VVLSNGVVAVQALGSELQALERNLRAKEEYMRKMASGGHQMLALKQHYDTKVGQMETEIERIQREKLELCTKLNALQVRVHPLDSRRERESWHAALIAAHAPLDVDARCLHELGDNMRR
jgi:chromosome segregation ATPase